MTEEIRRQVLRLGREITRAGLVVAAGGNIAARVGPDRVVVTPTGWGLADLTADDLAEVMLTGRQTGGPHAATSELPLHLAAFRARPDVAWCLHAHPPMATLLDALGIGIRTITTDHAYYLRSIARVPYLRPGTADVADAAAAELTRGSDVVLLRHHGCVVVADDPQLLLSRALNLEAAATATYRARLLGDDTTSCPEDYVEHARAEEAQGRRYGARHAPP